MGENRFGMELERVSERLVEVGGDRRSAEGRSCYWERPGSSERAAGKLLKGLRCDLDQEVVLRRQEEGMAGGHRERERSGFRPCSS